jgi:diguanylate cyclase (GGDEF)-like protein
VILGGGMRNHGKTRPDLEEAVLGLVVCAGVAEPGFLNQALMELSERLGPGVYSAFFRSLFHLETSPKEAEKHWKRILNFHASVRFQLSGPVDFRVSALYYLVNVAGLLSNPVVVEAEQYRKLLNDTLTDEMTGLHNFRFFQNVMVREFERAKRYGEPLSLIFIDIDHFKKFNDSHGHAEGDQVLKSVAKAILSSIRWSDWACRYGGEEFVIVLPGTAKENAVPLAERIRRKLARLDATLLKRIDTRITISAGVADFPQDAQRMEDLLHRADEALYLAKERGRNRIEIFPAAPEAA